MKNPSDFSAWMKRAFLYVEGSLLHRAAQETPTKITEDYVRGALVDGLKASKTIQANFIVTEQEVPWNRAPDICNPNAPFGNGRPKQHDVAYVENSIPKLACEVKWLKSKDPNAIMEDIWRLALTHGSSPVERDCCRTFFLVGGIKKDFQDTLAALRGHGVPLRWSPQGRAREIPRPSRVKLGELCATSWGLDRLAKVLRRNDKYFRQPPDARWDLRCSVLARSWKTIRESEWKIALWELDFRSPPCKDFGSLSLLQVDSVRLKQTFSRHWHRIGIACSGLTAA